MTRPHDIPALSKFSILNITRTGPIFGRERAIGPRTLLWVPSRDVRPLEAISGPRRVLGNQHTAHGLSSEQIEGICAGIKAQGLFIAKIRACGVARGSHMATAACLNMVRRKWGKGRIIHYTYNRFSSPCSSNTAAGIITRWNDSQNLPQKFNEIAFPNT